MAKPLIEDRTFLRHFWHPVCTRAEFEAANPSGLGPFGVELLGEQIVLANLNGEIVAMDDLCPHRHAALSKGRVNNGTLQCSYHGWQFDNGGKCIRIPACPEQPIPRRACTTRYECAVRYDIVWVRLDSSWDCTDIPYFSEWDKQGMRHIVVPSYEWKTGAERRWENFTDLSHFAFVHPGTLYDPAYDRPPIPTVDRIDAELRFAIEPPPEMLENLPENAPLGSFTYRCTMPFSINLKLRLYRDDSVFTLWTTSCPVSDDRCRNFLIISREERANDPDHAHTAFQKIVLEEDQPIIESQRPKTITMDELSVTTDKVSNQYRKWLRELSIAATEGKEAFVRSLRTQVIDSAS